MRTVLKSNGERVSLLHYSSIIYERKCKKENNEIPHSKIKEKKMRDIETKDYQLWKEYVEETQARELGFFNELDVAIEFFTNLT